MHSGMIIERKSLEETYGFGLTIPSKHLICWMDKWIKYKFKSHQIHEMSIDSWEFAFLLYARLNITRIILWTLFYNLLLNNNIYCLFLQKWSIFTGRNSKDKCSLSNRARNTILSFSLHVSLKELVTKTI